MFKQCSFGAAGAEGCCKFFGAAHSYTVGDPLFVIVGDVVDGAVFCKHR